MTAHFRCPITRTHFSQLLSIVAVVVAFIDFHSAVADQALLKTHCQKCHSGNGPKGDFDLRIMGQVRRLKLLNSGRAAWSTRKTVNCRSQRKASSPSRNARDWCRFSNGTCAATKSNPRRRFVLSPDGSTIENSPTVSPMCRGLRISAQIIRLPIFRATPRRTDLTPTATPVA